MNPLKKKPKGQVKYRMIRLKFVCVYENGAESESEMGTRLITLEEARKFGRLRFQRLEEQLKAAKAHRPKKGDINCSCKVCHPNET